MSLAVPHTTPRPRSIIDAELRQLVALRRDAARGDVNADPFQITALIDQRLEERFNAPTILPAPLSRPRPVPANGWRARAL